MTQGGYRHQRLRKLSASLEDSVETNQTKHLLIREVRKHSAAGVLCAEKKP